MGSERCLERNGNREVVCARLRKLPSRVPSMVSYGTSDAVVRWTREEGARRRGRNFRHAKGRSGMWTGKGKRTGLLAADSERGGVLEKDESGSFQRSTFRCMLFYEKPVTSPLKGALRARRSFKRRSFNTPLCDSSHRGVFNA